MHTLYFVLLFGAFVSLLPGAIIKSSSISSRFYLFRVMPHTDTVIQCGACLSVLWGWCLRLLLFLGSSQFPAKLHTSFGFKTESVLQYTSSEMGT